MPDLTAKRTLVKSPPELWEELSEIERLAKHLGAFGEITITKLEPEHTVAWEGEHASGTVSIEPSGWGTKVTLTADLPGEEPAEPEQVLEQALDEPPPGAAEPFSELDPAREPAASHGPTRAAAEPAAAGQPDAEGPAVEGSAPEEPAAEEPAPEASAVEEPAPEASAVEEPAPVEPVAEEPVVHHIAVPPARTVPADAKPARTRKRRFWARVFGRREPWQSAASPDAASRQAAAPQAAAQPPPDPMVAEPIVPPEQEVASPNDKRVVPVETALAEDQPDPMEGPPHTVEEQPVAVEDQPIPVEEQPVAVEDQPIPVEEQPVAVEDKIMRLNAELASLHQMDLPEDSRASESEDPPGLDVASAQAVLDEALDALGSAHHRPFSRG
jgi:hypothetical protein